MYIVFIARFARFGHFIYIYRHGHTHTLCIWTRAYIYYICALVSVNSVCACVVSICDACFPVAGCIPTSVIRPS